MHSSGVIIFHVCACILIFSFHTLWSSGFAADDGKRRLLELAQEMEEVFRTHDSAGQSITSVADHSHYRMLTSGCTTDFSKPKCAGSCASCSGTIAKAKCKARKLKCKVSSVEGLSFPFCE